MGRPTIAEINLSHLESNLESLKGYLKSRTKILAVVKADAYGHGAVPVASRLVECGVSHLGVATVEEGVQLRDGGVAENVVVLGGVMPDQLYEAISLGLDVVIGSIGHLEDIISESNRVRKIVGIHLKVDTEMGRLGIFPDEAERASRSIDEAKYVELKGVMSHLSSADGDEEEDLKHTNRQLRAFREVAGTFPANGVDFHVLNSAGIIRFTGDQHDMVRPGITLYGSLPRAGIEDIGLAPVMNLTTRIYYVKEFPAGFPISYGRKYVTKRRERIAVLPVGYADGLRKVLSPGFEVCVEGKPAKILGAICMDNIMIDVTDIPESKVGSEVMIFGEKWGVAIPVEEVAERASTIPYEILTGIGKRVPRVFVE
ncbi:MAG: alanine racemase [Deltaproteobacteria bacterium]|nr:alanine racemase [Deltaproteobacteria bacterium]NIS77571.1 alanine racemase [Deltaproteobacteria bacterium]